ncbi:Ferredoxin-NADP reductase [Alkalibacterium subtropicum]|uniref:Ferredoxin-NADP reductase n=1 Tax=Alkalibacterium subtropicum TaxID=753702 RepID=A0A1I1K8W4_9LACT|nr:FAD-dependent oxidoreductase [Alkalibacterium subtropicum]SFC57387.1 Ferredoxin-NADP reductase [Alkalibacterium subtropicum]
MKINDFKGMFNRTTLTVHSITHPHDDYYVILFNYPKDLIWAPGEHGVFTIPGKKVSGQPFRIFSIASPPSETKLMIATSINEPVSDFKKTLFSLSEGDKVNMIGPFGWYKTKDTTSPIVLIAAGIGITPNRAMVKQLEYDTRRDIFLVYSSSDTHLFKEEIDRIAEGNPRFHPFYTKDRNQTRQVYEKLADTLGNDAIYYIAGKPKTVLDINKRLRKNGVSFTHIVFDPYIGY